ncbi:Triple functional domain protein [Frankliniella fusca]|uniref:Triple functional domain protein n=1 Tax=Frankliniella fusca TaxID=407009 RepID=A0AAE1LKN3_9NEOP|nr:Triple functional domain protein [Frankliniella fusca]
MCRHHNDTVLVDLAAGAVEDEDVFIPLTSSSAAPSASPSPSAPTSPSPQLPPSSPDLEATAAASGTPSVPGGGAVNLAALDRQPLIGEPPAPPSTPVFGGELPPPPPPRAVNPFAYNVSSVLDGGRVGAAPTSTAVPHIVPIGFVRRPEGRPDGGAQAQLPPPALKKHMHSAQGHFGPYFEDGPGPHNVTTRVGSTVTLNCRVGMLQDKTVSQVL